MANPCVITGRLPFSNCVSSLAAGFRFHLYSMLSPCPQILILDVVETRSFLDWSHTGAFDAATFLFVLDSLLLFWPRSFLVSISGRPLLLFHRRSQKWLHFWDQFFVSSLEPKSIFFWHLWQVIPDWLVLDATGCEQSELLLLCCGSTSMIPAASLWNKFSCHRLLHDGDPWVDTCCLLGSKTMQRNCRGTSKCLQSCWGLEKLV